MQVHLWNKWTMFGAGSVWEISVPYSQFFFFLWTSTALKELNLFIKNAVAWAWSAENWGRPLRKLSAWCFEGPWGREESDTAWRLNSSSKWGKWEQNEPRKQTWPTNKDLGWSKGLLHKSIFWICFPAQPSIDSHVILTGRGIAGSQNETSKALWDIRTSEVLLWDCLQPSSVTNLTYTLSTAVRLVNYVERSRILDSKLWEHRQTTYPLFSAVPPGSSIVLENWLILVEWLPGCWNV